jgi:hypothetical protein
MSKWHGKLLPGGAFNTVDYRDEVDEGTRAVEGRKFDPNIGF